MPITSFKKLLLKSNHPFMKIKKRSYSPS